MLISMVCWGSWPNFLKKLPGWRLEYFYIDYTLGFLITAVLWGPGDGLGFLDVVSHAGAREATFAIVGDLACPRAARGRGLAAGPCSTSSPLGWSASRSASVSAAAPRWSALWGVFVWDEFAKGPASSRAFIGAALVLYAVGIATMAIAYTF